METLVKPNNVVHRIWSTKPKKQGNAFRLMRYVLRINHKNGIYLYNMVTGQLSILNQDETSLLEKLPAPYDLSMDNLIEDSYLVPIEFDEFQRVNRLRIILNKLEDASSNSKSIISYTILPTTACNARCYYCWQQGIETGTMTEAVAIDVARFIVSHCNGEKVEICWFGGEPLVAVNRIDQICSELRNNKVRFYSRIITNGYLFDEKMIDRATKDWHLRYVQITVDGVGENYKRIKSFIGVAKDPYKQVMHNIGILLDKGVHVALKMNINLQNYMDFLDLLSDVDSLGFDKDNLEIRVNTIEDGLWKNSATHDEKLNKIKLHYNMISFLAGLQYNRLVLPQLNHHRCPASSDRKTVILPSGHLVSCMEKIGQDEIVGDINYGITNNNLVQKWKQLSYNEKCKECVCFPTCYYLQNCSGGHVCNVSAEKEEYLRMRVMHFIDSNIIKEEA